MKPKISIIDFDDSFTYNIASCLLEIDSSLDIDILHYKSDFSDLLNCCELNRGAVIYGPGPGHPDEYKEQAKQIPSLLKKENIYFMGICLGHQLFHIQNGHKVIKLDKPIHGQAMELNFQNDSDKQLDLIKVQLYNSLGVLNEPHLEKYYKNIVKDNIIWASEWHRGSTYQFHPESIGTDNSERFFSKMLDFLYNR